MGNTGAQIEQKEVEFKLHIAIDFGTDGCGIAFGYDDQVIIYNKWKGRNRKRKNKTKTQILLGDNDQLLCFGDNAKMTLSIFLFLVLLFYEYIINSYCGAAENASKSWKFFERFKMALYDKNIKRLNIIDGNEEKVVEEVDVANELISTNGQKCDSGKIFIIAFKHLQKLAKEYLPKITKQDIKNEEIQWILTVPAIWSENAKNKMRQWIISAGLVDETIKNQCIIVYEPDCAALSLKKQILSNMNNDINNNNNSTISNLTDDKINDNDDDEKTEFIAGDRYILIDAGGGTVDIACHEIRKDGGVEEIIHPTGDKWGSCYIDDLYIQLLEEIFSKEWINEYKEKAPGKYVEIIENFQYAKCTFYEDNKDKKCHDIEIPFEFLCFLEEKCDAIKTKPEAIIKTFRKPLKFYRKLFKTLDIDNDNNDEKVDDDDICELTQVTVTSTRRDKNDEEYIEMDYKIWKCMFDTMINKIINHLSKLLNMESMNNNKCKYLCLVGGFCSSLYFQERINKYFINKINKIIIPSIPMLSVVHGAALFGIDKSNINNIKARRLKYTYGIKMFFNKTRARLNGIDEKYIFDNTTSDGMVRDCFKIIAKRNDRIELNEIKTTNSFKTSQISLIPILRSNKRNPKIAKDGIEESVLKIHHNDSKKETICTEFHFYSTMISVYSYPKNNINDKQKIDINYQQ